MILHLVLCVVALGTVATSGFSDIGPGFDDKMMNMHVTWMGYINECNDEFGMTMDDWKTVAESKNIDDGNSCAMACVMKKAGYMNDQGQFDSDYMKQEGLSFLKNEEHKEKFIAATDDCGSVNNENVSDGVKGCEMAVLIAKCFMKYMPK